MNGTEFISRGSDHLGFIRTQLTDLRGYATLANELIQNADDAPGATTISFDVRKDSLIVDNDGAFSDCGSVKDSVCAWLADRSKKHMCDFHRFRTVASGDKRTQEGTSGAFGIGFIAVYQVCDHPEVISSKKHWILFDDNPEPERISSCLGCEKCSDVFLPKTRFILPWAEDASSPLREAFQCESISHDDKEKIVSDLLEYIPSAMLFLRKLSKIIVKKNGSIIKQFESLLIGDSIYISDGDISNDRIWHLLQGDFGKEAEKLRLQYPERIEQKRSADVTIAIPSSDFDKGVFCAFLPTQQYTGLPFHINADFYPKSDRKGIVLEQDFRSIWNRCAIKASAQILSANIESLAKKIRHKQLWDIIQATNRVIEEIEKGRIDESLKDFWLELTKDIDAKKVFYNTKCEWVSANKVCYLFENDEEEALSILTDLGISIVHEDLRQFRNIFRTKEIGLKAFDIFDMIQKLHIAGLDKKTVKEDIPRIFTNNDSLAILWKEIHRLYNRVKKEDKRKCEEMLWGCAIAPSTDGALCLCEDSYYDDDDTISLFKRWDNTLNFIDNHQEEFSPLKKLCNPFTLFAAIDSIKQLLQHSNPEVNQLIIYNWLEARKSDILKDDEIKDAVVSLPIFPTKHGFKSLKSLTLPGDFIDPIGIADLLEVSHLEGRTDFVNSLGVKSLTFTSYVRDFVPHAFERMPLTENQKKDLVILLASRLGKIKDDADIQRKLQALEIVECCDGKWYEPREVYFKEEIVLSLLGKKLQFALLADGHQLALREFYLWLGVAAEPREDDVLARVRELSQSLPTDDGKAFAHTIIRYYGEKNNRGEKSDRVIDVLKRTNWLPAQNNVTRYFKPAELFAKFRQYLFSTADVHFLDVERQTETAYIDFLVLCGLNKDPQIEHVLAHTLNCIASNDISMNREVYNFLSYSADERTIRQLKEKPCLLLGTKFVKPDQVFWSQHQFGSYRYVLGPDFRKYGDLLEPLGVRETPCYSDAKEVLLEISDHCPENSSLDENNSEIYLNCWKLIESELLGNRVDVGEISSLSKKRVVSNPEKILQPPEWMFFDDRAGLSAKFDGLLTKNVTPRIMGVWRAMEAAGVHSLSESTSIELVERRDPLTDQLVLNRLQERKQELVRVLESEIQDTAAVLSMMTKLDTIDIVSTSELKGKYTIKVFDNNYSSAIEDLPVVFLSEENILYFCRKDSSIPWPAIARELSIALCPNIEPGRLASAMKDVLSAADTKSAQQILDDLGFPSLVSSRTGTTQTGTTITSFGGTETVPGAEPTPTTQPTIPTPPTPPPPPTTGVKGAIETILGGNVPPPNPPPEGLGKGEYAPGGDTKGTEPPKKWIGKVKVRSYFSGGGGTQEGDPDDYRERSATDKAGIEKVVAYEISCGLQPDVKPHTHPGYDIESRNADGSIERYIEVKSLSRDWDSLNAEMTKTQFNKAIEIGDKFWLYVVENAQTDEYEINRIPNPARLVLKYVYDGGWKDFANQ